MSYCHTCGKKIDPTPPSRTSFVYCLRCFGLRSTSEAQWSAMCEIYLATKEIVDRFEKVHYLSSFARLKILISNYEKEYVLCQKSQEEKKKKSFSR